MPPSIDVVIPVRDGWALTKSCLERLRSQTLRYVVVVVDNGSEDGTPDRIRDAFPEVRVLELGTNAGFPAACNRGVRAGDGDIVVLLNNDVECPPAFLEHLVAPLAADNRVGSVAALLLDPDEERVESFGLAADATLAGFPRLRGLSVRHARSARSVLAGPSGAAGAYRRDVWEAVGGLDEGVLFYGEDLDLALRIRSAGWSTAAASDAVAVHLGSSSASHRSAWQRYQGGFARGYFLRRYGVLRGRYGLRALATELLVGVGDAAIYSHDLVASRGRIAGWRAAAGRPRNPYPPDVAIDDGIGFWSSLRLRRGVYAKPEGDPSLDRVSG